MMQIRVVENVGAHITGAADACEDKAIKYAEASADLALREESLTQHMLHKWLAFRFKRLEQLHGYGDLSWEQLFELEVKQAAELAVLSPTLGNKHRAFLVQLMDCCCTLEV